MHKSKNVMMISMLRDVTLKEIHILAVQKLWQNSHMNITHCSSSCSYWSVYSSDHWSRACLMISKKLPHSIWTVKHLQSDIVSVILQLNDIMMHIHSMYVSRPEGLHRVNHNFSIYRILQLLQKSDEHILLEDFNLHHSRWEETTCLDRHDMADELWQFIQQTNLQLLTLSDTVIWKKEKLFFTINLIFITSEMTRHMIKCVKDDRLKHESNHLSIITEFFMNNISQIVQKK